MLEIFEGSDVALVAAKAVTPVKEIDLMVALKKSLGIAKASEREAFPEPVLCEDGATMTVTVRRKDIVATLRALVPITPKRSTLPILSYVMLEIGKDGGAPDFRPSFKLTATDLDQRATVEIDASWLDERGACCVIARDLLDTLKQASGEYVSLSLSKDGTKLHVVSGDQASNMLTLPADEFPAGVPIQWDVQTPVRAGDLHDMSDATRGCASTEESRPILNGVLWEFEKAAQRFVATNGHRMGVRTLPLTQPVFKPGVQFILPIAALQSIGRLFGTETMLTLGNGPGGDRNPNDLAYLGWRSESVTFTTRLIEGPYPNYGQSIPKDNGREALCDREALLTAVKTLLPLSSEQTHRIAFEFRQGKPLTISTHKPDAGDTTLSLRHPSECEYKGVPLTVAYNAKYMRDILSVMDTERVRLTFKDSERTATLHPVGEQCGSTLYLLMPLRLVD